MASDTVLVVLDGFETVASMANVLALSPPVTPGGTMVLLADTLSTLNATVGSPFGATVVVVVGATVVVVVAGALVVVVVAATVVVVVGATVVVVVGATVVVVVAGAFVVVVAATVVVVTGALVVVVAASVVDVVDGAVEGVVAAVVVVVRCGRGGRGRGIVGNVIVGRVCGVLLSSPVPSSPLSVPSSLPAADVAVVGRTPVGVAAARVLTRFAAAGLAAGVVALAGPVALPDVVAWNPWLCVTATAGLADSRIPVADTRRRLVFCMSTSLRMG